MLLSTQNKAAITQFVEQTVPQAIREKMIKSTVRLEAGQFRGSGVIFNVQDSQVEILTCAHNLLAWAKEDPPNNWGNLEDRFAEALTIRYDPAGSIFNAVPQTPIAPNKITDITVPPIKGPCENVDNCYYDLAVITCLDGGLAGFARGFLGNNYSLSAEATAICEEEGYLLFTDRFDHLILGYGSTTGARHKQKVVEGKMVMEDDETVHTGTPANEMGGYHLHYRGALPEKQQYITAYDQIAKHGDAPKYQANGSIILLKATRNNSTAPGDSGGPLYGILRDTTWGPDVVERMVEGKLKRYKVKHVVYQRAFLLGLTTGADGTTAEEPPADIFINDVSTSVIPYLRTRK